MNNLTLIVLSSLGFLALTQGASIKEKENISGMELGSILDKCKHENRSDLISQLFVIDPVETSNGRVFVKAWDTLKEKQLRTNETFQTLNITLNNYCGMNHASLKEKADGLIQTIRVCFPSEEYVSIWRQQYWTMNYICDHKDEMADFIKDGGLDCMLEKGGNLIACESFAFKEFRNLSSGTSENTRACEGFKATQKYYQCQREVLKECKSHIPHKILDYYSDQLPKESPCEGITTVVYSEDALLDPIKPQLHI